MTARSPNMMQEISTGKRLRAQKAIRDWPETGTDDMTTGKKKSGRQGGIRTPGRLPPTSVFKTDALNHSATCPHSSAQ